MIKYTLCVITGANENITLLGIFDSEEEALEWSTEFRRLFILSEAKKTLYEFKILRILC